jgi:hypothetical protein
VQVFHTKAIIREQTIAEVKQLLVLIPTVKKKGSMKLKPPSAHDDARESQANFMKDVKTLTM